MEYQAIDITNIVEGVNPTPDNTNLASMMFTEADKVRFIDGFPEKIGGWAESLVSNGVTLQGKARSAFSFRKGNNLWLLIGTHSHLYAYTGNDLTNITPLDTTTTTIANSLATYYVTLGTDPITTVNGSNTVTIAATAHKLEVGDTITISGVSGTDVNGIPVAELNTSLVVRSIATDSFTVRTSTSASSAGSGGGASVVLATPVITVTQSSHGASEGDRIKLTLAADTGGILAANINKEHIVRNVTTNTMDIVCSTNATSSVSSSGGASTAIQHQIAAGEADQSFGRGWGIGKWGVGKWGVSKTSSNLLKEPRIWSFDRFGNDAVLTPGGGGKLYIWEGDTSVAPTVLTNSPSQVNWVFVYNDIIVTLGAYSAIDGNQADNRVRWSERGDGTIWSPSAVVEAGENIIRDANKLRSAAKLQSGVLLFTPDQTYIMRDIGGEFVFSFTRVDGEIGIIAPNAVDTSGDMAFWMGADDFYMYNGGNITPITANTKTGQNPLTDYVFKNITTTQPMKCFAWLNKSFGEMWFHYPSATSNEPDRYVHVRLAGFVWTTGTLDRLCVEQPSAITGYPRLVDADSVIYRHEIGVDADGSAMDAYLVTNWRQPQGGWATAEIGGIIPDSVQTGDMNLTLYAKLYPQTSMTETYGSYTIGGSTEKIDFTAVAGVWKYRIESNAVNGNFRMGKWRELLMAGTGI